MKQYLVVGLERKQGSFTNESGKQQEYDNILLKCLVQSTSARDKKKIIKGFDVSEIKVKNDFDNLVYVSDGSVNSFVDMVGCIIELDQNIDGKIECVEVVKKDAFEVVL